MEQRVSLAESIQETGSEIPQAQRFQEYRFENVAFRPHKKVLNCIQLIDVQSSLRQILHV